MAESPAQSSSGSPTRNSWATSVAITSPSTSPSAPQMTCARGVSLSEPSTAPDQRCTKRIRRGAANQVTIANSSVAAMHIQTTWPLDSTRGPPNTRYSWMPSAARPPPTAAPNSVITGRNTL